MVGIPGDDDINRSIIDTVAFTTNPQIRRVERPPPPSAAMAASADSQSATDTDHDPDPPPPLPMALDNPSASEVLAASVWLLRNRTYISTIPWHRYSSPPVLSWLWGYNDGDFRHECLSSLMFYTQSTGRRLTTEERDALLDAVTRNVVAVSYDRPIALGLGAWLVARSWAKSGAAAPPPPPPPPSTTTTTTTTNPYAGAGHMTHFSTPPPPPPTTAGRVGLGFGVADALSSLLKRAVRASVPGLLCFAGLHVLQQPIRQYLGENEMESIHGDLRLERMLVDMDDNLSKQQPTHTRP